MKDYGIALVTGGGSGIGRAAAARLAEEGARLVIADIDREAAEAVAEALRASGGQALSIGLDVADEASVDAAFHQAEMHYGKGVDILVNSAGVLMVEPLLSFKKESWDRVMAVNVTGTFLCGQRAARAMSTQGYGRIINMASISGLRAGVGRTAYGTSKAAVLGLTRQFALELGPQGVTANAIAPGVVETPMTQAAYSEATWQQVLGMVPVRRLGAPEDIAEAVAYLASPAAGYVNGETLTVDGGYLACGMTQTGSLAVDSDS